MKRWALVTVILYFLVLLCLTVPVWIDCFGWGSGSWRKDAGAVTELFAAWGYWVWIGVSLLGQILLLMVPVASMEGRPQKRRRLMVPVLTSAFLFALLCLTAVGSLAVAIWKDDGLNLFTVFGEGNRMWLGLLIYICVPWIAWALVFRRFLKQDDPKALSQRLMRWLLRGSILELLVAVPSHIIVRQREVCCAPIMTFWGIATGLTVMLMSFGPGVFFLFVERMRRLQPKAGEPGKNGGIKETT